MNQGLFQGGKRGNLPPPSLQIGLPSYIIIMVNIAIKDDKLPEAVVDV